MAHGERCEGMAVLQRLNNLSLKRKILLLAVGVELLVLGVAALFGLYVLSSDRSLLSQSMASSLSYSAQSMQRSIDTAQKLSTIMLGDDIIQEQLSLVASGEDTPARRIAYHALYNRVLKFFQEYSHDHIQYISLINGSFITHSGIFSASNTPDALVNTLCERAIAREGRVWMDTQWTEEYGLFVARAIRQIQPFDLKNIGVLQICIDFDAIIGEATAFSNAYEQTYYMIRDERGVFYRSDELANMDTDAIFGQLDGDYGVVDIGDAHYFVQRGAIDAYGWQYLCMVSYDEQWQQQQNSYMAFIIVLLVALLLAVLLSSVIADSISKHFTALINKMQRFRGQALYEDTEGANESTRTDEVGLLHQQFDHMAQEITELIQDRYVSELLIKEAQFKSLEAQINPHFLYNVLESINWRAHTAGITQISEIVDALGHFLRISLDRQSKLITFEQELKLVGYYVTIQRYRFEEQMVYSQVVPDSLLHVRMPKLVVQPLVENAVKYAVETAIDAPCQIIVEAFVQGSDLVVLVKNTGSYMEEDLLERLNSKEIAPHGLGIGLVNINERLRLTFGDAYGLTLYNEAEFAVCRICVPINYDRGEDENA